MSSGASICGAQRVRSWLVSCRRLALTLGLGLVVAMITPALAQAVTYTVTTTVDSNDGACTAALCSFRDALNAADGQPANTATVIVPAGTYKATTLATNGDFSPGGQYTIQGAGAGKTIIDGNGLDRVFAFYGQITVSGVTVTGGKAPLAGCECGGAFEVRQGGFLTLLNSVVQGNSAPGGGGGIDVDSQSKAILQNDLISQNTSPSAGGGIHVGPASGQFGSLQMAGVTISGNSTTGGASGGGLDNQGSTTGSNVTFAGNVSSGDGGGVMNESTGTLSLTNSTLSTNTATGVGAGIRNLGSSGSLNVRNAIVADGCSGPVSSQGHNLDAGGSCAFGQPGDVSNQNPQLGPLGSDGGPIPTMALLTGSPAINAGDNSACPATDARGVSRPQGGVCDIGAYEYAPPTLALGAVTGTGISSATLNGSVNPNLRDASYHFEYGTTTAYGSSTPGGDAGPGASPTAVAATLNGLSAGTTYHYRLVASNGDGTSSTPDATFTTASLAQPVPPALTNVSQSAARWLEHKRSAKAHGRHQAKLPVGTTFAFTLNETARVTFTFTQSANGRLVHKACVQQTKKNRRKPMCSRTLTRGAFSLTGQSGKNKVFFNGSVPRGPKLKPGAYTVVITAVTPAGQTFGRRTLQFVIVKT